MLRQRMMRKAVKRPDHVYRDQDADTVLRLFAIARSEIFHILFDRHYIFFSR